MSKELHLEAKTCPDTFLYTKLAIEQCEHGERLTVYYANSETVQRVYSSLILEGIAVSVLPTGNHAHALQIDT